MSGILNFSLFDSSPLIMASKANQMEAGEKAVAYDARSNSSDVAAGTMITHEAAIVNAPLDMSELKDMNKGLHSRHL